MKRSALFLVTALILIGADTPDLSGTWELNVEKSTFGKRPAPITMKLEVMRQESGFHSKLTSTDGSGNPQATEGDWFLDGKYHTIPATKWTQMSKWDGSALVAENKSADGTYEEHLKLTVSTDGKRATENRTIKDSQGSNSSTLIWDRK